MQKKLSSTLKTALTVITALATTQSFANLVNNSSFENGYSNWTYSGFGILDYSTYSHSGSNSMATGCMGHSCVSTQGSGAFFGQTISTVTGRSYELSFWVGESSGPTSEFSVFWNGQLLANVLNPANYTMPNDQHSGMIQYTYTGLLASGSNTYFEIHGRQDPGGIMFDDVSVINTANAVPEPASLLLVSGGLLGIAVTRRRSRRA